MHPIFADGKHLSGTWQVSNDITSNAADSINKMFCFVCFFFGGGGEKHGHYVAWSSGAYKCLPSTASPIAADIIETTGALCSLERPVHALASRKSPPKMAILFPKIRPCMCSLAFAESSSSLVLSPPLLPSFCAAVPTPSISTMPCVVFFFWRGRGLPITICETSFTKNAAVSTFSYGCRNKRRQKKDKEEDKIGMFPNIFFFKKKSLESSLYSIALHTCINISIYNIHNCKYIRALGSCYLVLAIHICSAV